MEQTYKLEFNEEQQEFHLNDGLHEENTYGWFTIFEHCTYLESHIYEAFVNRIAHEKLTKAYLIKCKIEIEKFMNNLLEYGIVISDTVDN